MLILIDTDSKVTSSLDEGNSEDMAERRGAERESGPGEKINLTEFFNSRQNGARKTWNEGVGELRFAGLDEVIADEADVTLLDDTLLAKILDSKSDGEISKS